MIGSVSTKYALRSLFRHPRRSALSVVGVGIGVAIGLIAISYYSGAAEMQVRAVSESGAGHLRIVPAGWDASRENSMRLAQWEEALRIINGAPHVKVIVPRARANGLLAFGNRTVGVELNGVVPNAEWDSNRIVRKAKLEGRYLQEGDRSAVVIGKSMAKRLNVELDDDLMLTVAGREDIQGAMLRIVGILDTGSSDLDSMICHVLLSELEAITDFTGPGEISVLLENQNFLDSTYEYLLSKINSGNTVITWKDVNPSIAATVESDGAFIRFLSFMIVVLVALGIASAQLTAFLERRAEFGVLMALGMKPRQVVGLILIEAVITGIAGAIVALLLGGPVAYLLATKGINLAVLFSEELTFGGILLDPYIYADFGIWIVWYALSVAVTATVVASFYPIWYAIRTNPVEALRGV